jgi:hypothetical protein
MENNQIEQIENALVKNGIYADVYNKDEFPSCTVTVFIEGDWKHDHLFAVNILSDLGFSEVREDLIGSSDSDYYKSEHTFIKGSKEFVKALHEMFGIN